jgi:putative nucleotidyltransferase with HDIG domain
MDFLKRLRETFSFAALDFYFGPDDPHFKTLQEFQDEQMRLIYEMPSLHTRPTGTPAETYGHSMRVAEDAYTFALYIGMPMQIAKNIRWATMLHDIGKLDVPVEILDKPGRLDDAEFQEMKNHTKYGAERIKSLGLDHKMTSLAHDIALYHHERHDGRGYYGLAGNEIPSRVRLVQLCDIYDAVSAPRPYRSDKEQLTPYDTMKNLMDHDGFLYGAVDQRFAKPFCLLKVNLLEGDLSREHHQMLEKYLLEPLDVEAHEFHPSPDVMRRVD